MNYFKAYSMIDTHLSGQNDQGLRDAWEIVKKGSPPLDMGVPPQGDGGTVGELEKQTYQILETVGDFFSGYVEAELFTVVKNHKLIIDTLAAHPLLATAKIKGANDGD